MQVYLEKNDFNLVHRNVLKNIIDYQACVKKKPRSRSNMSSRLPYINKLKYNFIEAIQENFEEDNIDSCSDCSDSDIPSKTPMLSKRYLPLL